MKCMSKKVMAEKARLANEMKAKEHEEFLANMTPEERQEYEKDKEARMERAMRLLHATSMIHSKIGYFGSGGNKI